MNYSRKHLELAMRGEESKLIKFDSVTNSLLITLKILKDKLNIANSIHRREIVTMCIQRINLRLTKHLNSLDDL